MQRGTIVAAKDMVQIQRVGLELAGGKVELSTPLKEQTRRWKHEFGPMELHSAI